MVANDNNCGGRLVCSWSVCSCRNSYIVALLLWTPNWLNKIKIKKKFQLSIAAASQPFNIAVHQKFNTATVLNHRSNVAESQASNASASQSIIAATR